MSFSLMISEPNQERLQRQKARLRALRDEAHERYSGGAPALQVAALISEMTDQLVVELFEESLQDLEPACCRAVAANAALIAVGGSGRGELAPYSDADLLFLHGRCPPQFAECVSRTVRDCWDAGIKLGHSVRTTADAIDMGIREIQFATAAVEARLLWGSERLFEQFRSRFYRKVVRSRYKTFFHACVQAREAERRQHGATERQLEPEVKRSPGALRDIHLIRWIGYGKYGTTDLDLLRLGGALSREDQQALIAAQQFLTRVRVDLHFGAGKAQDVLTREEQLRLADLHGFTATPTQRPVERFMQAYFRHSTAIADIADRFVARHRPRSWLAVARRFLLAHRSNQMFQVQGDRIEVIGRYRETVCGSLEEILHLYELAGQYSAEIAPEILEEIKRAVPNLPRTLSERSCRLFLSILGTTGQVGRLLRSMFATGVLEIILPEITHARCLLQFNQYHSYTVDEHSFRAVEAAEQLEADPGPVGQACRLIRQRNLLHLAVLLHDLGKGFEEDHSDVGRRIAADVARRLGLSAHQSDTLQFLVHKHLLMAHLAFRRDLSDQDMLARFSRDVGSPENLRMLYSLTAADVSAVGPGVWTGWKCELVTELYERAMQILSGAPARFREAEIVEGLLSRVKELAARQNPSASSPDGTASPGDRATADDSDRRLRDRLAKFPLHYLTATSVEQIAEDLEAVSGLSPSQLAVRGRYDAATRTVEYRFLARDSIGSGLFGKFTGTLTVKGMTILSANICTTSDGVVIDRFRVEDTDYSGAVPDDRIDEVAAAASEVVAGRRTVESLFQRHTRYAPGGRSGPLVREPTRVVIDNDTSERFTIIDVFAHDRRGLLYAVARTLRDLELSISLAKISTHLDQVLDVFYVTDRQGGKIRDDQRLERMQLTLLGRIEEFERQGVSAWAV
jgi:[protein-PII] uridylyltransferase